MERARPELTLENLIRPARFIDLAVARGELRHGREEDYNTDTLGGVLIGPELRLSGGAYETGQRITTFPFEFARSLIDSVGSRQVYQDGCISENFVNAVDNASGQLQYRPSSQNA